MDGFTNFLADNYIWFLITSLIMVFALIGYWVDMKDTKSGKKLKKQKEELKIVDFSSVDQSKSLNESIKEEKGELNLDDYSKKSAENTEQVSTEQLNNIGESNLAEKTDSVPETPTVEETKNEEQKEEKK